MSDPMTMVALAHSTLTFLASHAPWLGDKAGGAVITQTVRETWELLKSHLSGQPESSAAVQKLESGESTDPNSLLLSLAQALERDEVFRNRLEALLDKETGFSQKIDGDSNKQGGISGSPGARLQIS